MSSMFVFLWSQHRWQHYKHCYSLLLY